MSREDSDLHDLVDTMGDALSAQLEAELAAVPPDFADVLARAQALGAEPLASPGGEREQDEFSRDELTEKEAAQRAQLAPFAAAYRELTESELVGRPLPQPRHEAASSRRAAWWLGAAAAALLIVGGGAWALNLAGQGQKEAQDKSGDQAADLAASGASEGVATPLEWQSRPGVAVQDAPKPEPEPEPEPELQPQVDQVEAPAPVKRPSLSLEERIERLEASAQAHWKAGRLDKAQRDYRRITVIGGKRRSAQLAYGELFSLARQLGESMQGPWEDYLQRFPQGIYAQDARAGLCRRARGASRDTCWQAYLSAFPKGAHAAKAREELAENVAKVDRPTP